jgi:hypothetical protein
MDRRRENVESFLNGHRYSSTGRKISRTVLYNIAPVTTTRIFCS